jgi:transcriptional regulator with XRE-family HTH domain
MSTKTKHPDDSKVSQLNERVVEEIHVWMARRRINQDQMADALGVSQVWVSRRIGRTRTVILTLDEVERFAAALDVETPRLFGEPGATGNPTTTLITRGLSGDSQQSFDRLSLAA